MEYVQLQEQVQAWVQHGGLPPSRIGMPPAAGHPRPQASMPPAGGYGGYSGSLQERHQQLYSGMHDASMNELAPRAYGELMGPEQFGSVSSAHFAHGPIICEECFGSNGKHTKRCSKLHSSETPEQRERRLKKEERMRDQELGAGKNAFTNAYT